MSACGGTTSVFLNVFVCFLSRSPFMNGSEMYSIFISIFLKILKIKLFGLGIEILPKQSIHDHL